MQLLWLLIPIALIMIYIYFNNIPEENILIAIDATPVVEKPIINCMPTRTPSQTDYMSLRNHYGPVLVTNPTNVLHADNDREAWRFHDSGLDRMEWTKKTPCFYSAMDTNLQTIGGQSLYY